MTDRREATLQHHDIVHEVLFETDKQIEKWGVQDHPMGTSRTNHVWANLARGNCEKAAEQGKVTYFDILNEEFYEASAEEDPEALEEELIQVAAVAVSMIAASRRARGAL